MKVYGKSWDYNVCDCQYCLFWKGRKTGCIYENGCCCPIPQKPEKRNGAVKLYPKTTKAAAPVSACIGCPYGRDSPCIGWCTKEVMRPIGLLKERDSPHV